MCRCLFRAKFPVGFVNIKCSPKFFMALYCLLLFMQNLFLLNQQLVIVLIATRVKDYGGFNSAAKTPSFSPALDISPAPFS